MQNLTEFIQDLRNCLHQGAEVKENNWYLDISNIEFSDLLPEVHLLGYPQISPFLPVFEIILEQISLCRLDRIKWSINEMIKFYLINLDEKQAVSCQELLYRIELVFRRCLMPDFPYQDKVWEYINQALQNLCLYLLNKHIFEEAELALETLAKLGRLSAQESLPTAHTQSALRLIELKAGELAQHAIVSRAKNYRFNLET